MASSDYTLRVSSRARHVRLKVTAADGLCVVVPKGFDESGLPALLEEKQAWIARAFEKVGGAPKPLAEDYFPEELDLPAINEHWRIAYLPGGSRTRLRENLSGHRLSLEAAVHGQEATFSRLRQWLRSRASQVIVPQAYSLAGELGFEVNGVTIRNQRSRWGSCSSKKNLSLNLKLLFVTPRQLRYVLFHELCHTVEMNHSARFWGLLEEFEPESRALKQSMRRAWRDVPAWV